MASLSNSQSDDAWKRRRLHITAIGASNVTTRQLVAAPGRRWHGAGAADQGLA
jgi:hypothetical protein